MSTITEDSPIVSANDFLYAFRLLQKLSTPFNKMNAYRLGIIDKDGKILKKREEFSSNDRDAFTYMDLIVVNLKRMLKKQSPLTFNQITPNVIAASTFLLKEHYKFGNSNLTERAAYLWLKTKCFEGEIQGATQTNIITETKELDCVENLGRPGYVFGKTPDAAFIEKHRKVLESHLVEDGTPAMTTTGPNGMGGIGGNPGDGSALAGYDAAKARINRIKSLKKKKILR